LVARASSCNISQGGHSVRVAIVELDREKDIKVNIGRYRKPFRFDL
jgi:hypothetical protein